MGLDGFYYETQAGDTFDILALDAYNNEFLSAVIAQANPQHTQTVVFDAGTKLFIPYIREAPPESLPPWKR